MKFSLWNLKDWFETHGLDLSYMITDNAASISMLATSDLAAGGRLGCALIKPGDTQDDCTGFRSVLRFGTNRILFPVASPDEVLNLGMNMIEYYTSWENRLFDLILDGCSIETLLADSQRFFPHPTAVIHPSGFIRFQTPNWIVPLDAQAIGNLLTSIPTDTRETPSFRTLFFQQPHTFLCHPLLTHHVPSGVLISCERQKKFQPGDIHLFRTLAETIQTALGFHADTSYILHPYAEWFSHQLSGSGNHPFPADDTEWEKDAFYCIALVKPLKQDAAPLTGELTASLTNARHCCVLTEDGLAILVYLGKNIDTREAVEHLTAHCPPGSFKAGLSLAFRGLKHLPLYYRQAQDAARQSTEPLPAVKSIETCLSKYILQSCRKLPQTLIHPAVMRLDEIDKRDGEQLVKTLYTYLALGRSLSLTANVLFIHRNTLRYRLKKIHAFFGALFDDPAVREQLLLSLMLLDSPAF